jgi:hypothetical protein
MATKLSCKYEICGVKLVMMRRSDNALKQAKSCKYNEDATPRVFLRPQQSLQLDLGYDQTGHCQEDPKVVPKPKT